MNELERLEAILSGDPVDRPACICPMGTATIALMREANAFFPEVLVNPDKMARLAMAAHKVAGIESVRVPFDDTVEASAFGVALGKKNMQRHPIVLKHLISGPEDVDNLEVPDPSTAGNVPLVLEAIRLLDTEKRTLPVLVGITSPLMLAMQLRGDHEVMMDMANDPDLLKRLLQKCAEFDVEYMHLAFEAGADHLVIDDGLSSADFLTSDQFDQFAEPYEDFIANECNKYDFESILHICGDANPQLERMLDIDTNGYSIDQDVGVADFKRLATKRKVAVIGNLSPTKTLLMGDQNLVVEQTKKCIDEGVDCVAPGCSLELYTPIENLVRMVVTTRNYGHQRAKGMKR